MKPVDSCLVSSWLIVDWALELASILEGVMSLSSACMVLCANTLSTTGVLLKHNCQVWSSKIFHLWFKIFNAINCCIWKITFYYWLWYFLTHVITNCNFQQRNTQRVFYIPSLSDAFFICTTRQESNIMKSLWNFTIPSCWTYFNILLRCSLSTPSCAIGPSLKFVLK